MLEQFFLSHYTHTQGLATLQASGICHRDMSLENLLVHDSDALVIDLGMCLRIPMMNSKNTLEQSMANLQVSNASTSSSQQSSSSSLSRRQLITPMGTCGKWIYMSPEIYRNQQPFDGPAVDLWAAGVILFLMLTGFPPWERACTTDERFKYMTAGYLVQMLTEWDLGLSSDGMDLLQRMMFNDPADRLCLTQVWAHPWMQGPVEAPSSSRNSSGLL